jgi:small-conductance mechanosensitive channel
MRTHRRSEIKLELSPKTTAAETQQCIAEIKKLLETKKDSLETSSVYLSEISKNGLLLVIEYFTQPISIDLFNRLKEEVNMDLKKILEENNIETAVTSGTVTIINGPVTE